MAPDGGGHDHPGLLAELAGTLAGHGLSITGATATTWSAGALALISASTTQPGGRPLDAADWDAIGNDLRRNITDRARPEVDAPAEGPVEVRVTAQDAERVLVRLRAPDRIGLLATVAAWFADQGCNIEVVSLATNGTIAEDTFVVQGRVDAAALVTRLSGRPPAPSILTMVSGLATGLATTPIRVARNVLRR